MLSGKGKKDDTISTFKLCKGCWRKEHPLSRTENRHKTAEKKEKADASAATEVADQFDFFGASTSTRRRKRGRSGINDKTLPETLGLIEYKEAAAGSTTGSSASGNTTSYKKIAADDRRLKGMGKCERCAETFNNK